MLTSPVGVAWTLAGVVTLGLVVLIWPTDGAPPPRKSAGDGARDQISTTNRSGQSPRHDPSVNAGPAENPDVQDRIRGRLTRLGERLEAYRGTYGHFPTGTVSQGQLPPADRFSWLAELAAEGGPEGPAGRGPAGRPQPLWDQEWHDPLNDRFVRQPMPEFLNPAVGEQVGRNRFPATHFVGMAGVGPDAPELPIDHPRAGVFGFDRQTRLEDIQDGTANTILVAGVQGRLGGWAGGGPGSVRAFTREPYLNGPDGFGTGQAESMLVLMADGSVRTVSKATSPVIVRRMAAMADGLPLDDEHDEPGEPGEDAAPPSPDPQPEDVAGNDAPPPEDQAAVIPPADPVDDLLRELPVAAPLPAEPPIDIAAALAQKIERYEIPRPVLVRRILIELEEMIGAPLELDGGNTVELEARLDRAVAVHLEQTTVGGILDEVTRRAGLSYTIDGGVIRLRPAVEQNREGQPPTEGPSGESAIEPRR